MHSVASPMAWVLAAQAVNENRGDELVWIENSRRLRDRLQQLHRPAYLLELPWATHGFDANPQGPGGQLEGYAMRWFLAAVLTEPAPEQR